MTTANSVLTPKYECTYASAPELTNDIEELGGRILQFSIGRGNDLIPGTDATSNSTIRSEPELEKAINRVPTGIAMTRLTSVLVLLAKREGINFDEAAKLLGISASKLRRMTRFEENVSKQLFHSRIVPLSQILRNLHQVLEPRATGKWFNTQIPTLNYKTPAELVKIKKFDSLLSLTRTYTEPLAYI